MAMWKMHALAQRYLYSFARYFILNLSASTLEAKVSAGFPQIFLCKVWCMEKENYAVFHKCILE